MARKLSRRAFAAGSRRNCNLPLRPRPSTQAAPFRIGLLTVKPRAARQAASIWSRGSRLFSSSRVIRSLAARRVHLGR